MKLTKAERKTVLKAVDVGWYCDIDLFNKFPISDRLYRIAHDVLMVLDAEPWRGFQDVLNEVLDY